MCIAYCTVNDDTHIECSFLPGGGGQGNKQGLQNASDVHYGAFLSNKKVHGREDK